MPDRDRPASVPGIRGNALGLRLALAFLAVALVAVALLAGLTAAFAAADVTALANHQRTELTGAIAVAAAAAFDKNDSWASADLSPVLDLAEQTGADVQIRESSGQVAAQSHGFAAHASAPQYRKPVTVHGQRQGEVIVRFTGSGLGGADRGLEVALLRAIAGAAGLAALLALVTGLGVARRITRPVERIIAVTRAMGRGERTARVGQVTAPGELRELAAAFDQMADTLARQEQLRRDLVADVAHELRTPVAVLQAGHEALLDGVTEPTPEELASLRDEVLRLARMVSDLQGLAAADAAALHLSPRRCDLVGPRRRRRDQPGRPVRGRGHQRAAGPRRGRRPGRPALAAPGHHEPAHQRAEVHPGGRARHRPGRARRAGRGAARSSTPASGFPPTSCRTSSTGSGAAGRPRRPRAAASAWPSPPSSPRRTEGS